MGELNKLDLIQKLRLYPPELEVYIPISYNQIQVIMKSPKYLEPIESEYEFKVSRIQSFMVAHLYTMDSLEKILERIKNMINKVADTYYKQLEEFEMYEIPDELKDKILGNLIIVNGEES